MLQTSANQLMLKQHVLKHRQIIANELTAAGYDIVTLLSYCDTRQKYDTLPVLINEGDSPISINLDVDISIDDDNLEFIELDHRSLYCEKFTTEDIQSLTYLYLHMLQKGKTQHPNYPEYIRRYSRDILVPGQLSKIITEYFKTKGDTN